MTTESDGPSEPGTLGRLRLVMPKLKARGARWLFQRLLDELRKPATLPGLWLRRLNVTVYGALMTVAFLPWRLLFAPRRIVTLFYDLEVSPITFDACFALLNAELERLRLGFDRVQVVIVPGPVGNLRSEDADYEEAVDKESRRWRIDNIVVPLCRLMPSVSGITVCSTRRQATAIRAMMGRNVYPRSYWPLLPLPHTPNEVLDAARAGRVTRPFQASEQARRYVRQWLAMADGRRIITITLRQYGFMQARNSNLSAWSEFARRRVAEGYFVVFIPDTDSALAPPAPELAGFEIFGEAAWNLALRMALYEASWLNMMVNNGPFGCVAFSEAPYLMFKILTDGVRMTSAQYMRHLGYELEVTPPFANPWQKWVWEDDDLPVLEREFQAMREQIDQRTRNDLKDLPADDAGRKT